MSVAVAESSGCFLSALQPNTTRTAYVVPSDGPSPDAVAKARRVREQVRMRLAEKKKSSSLPRLDDTLVSSTEKPNPLTEEQMKVVTKDNSSESKQGKPKRLAFDNFPATL